MSTDDEYDFTHPVEIKLRIPRRRWRYRLRQWWIERKLSPEQRQQLVEFRRELDERVTREAMYGPTVGASYVLSADEAKAVKNYIMGDHFDPITIDRVLRKLDDA